jgi:tetratricopeptide (TPR) repeat protein
LQRPEEALGYRKVLLDLQPNDPDVLERYAWSKYSLERNSVTILSPRDTKEYERLLRKSIALAADTVDRYRARLADLFFGTQRYALAMDQYARTIQIRGTYTQNPNVQDDALFLQLARCLHYLHKNERAAGFALEALKFNPQNEEAKDLFYDIWMKGTPSR